MHGETDGLGDQLQALRLFALVARTGSFSKGAREMKLSQPTASRIIALLEEELGTTLFFRSTRALTLTVPGRTYLASVQPILALLDEANDAARGSADLRGTLRVGVASIFASRAIVPGLPAFLANHPGLKVELIVDDRRRDLIQDGIDVAIRFGPLPDSSMIARLIGRWPLIAAASPTYLARHGSPDRPESLSDHRFVIAGPVAGKSLTFRRGDQEVTVEPRGQVSIDGAEVAVAAVRAGLGVAVASLPSFSQELQRGELLRVLPEWRLGEIEAHAIFASTQATRPAAQAFVEHLIHAARTL